MREVQTLVFYAVSSATLQHGVKLHFRVPAAIEHRSDVRLPCIACICHCQNYARDWRGSAPGFSEIFTYHLPESAETIETLESENHPEDVDLVISVVLEPDPKLTMTRVGQLVPE